jgi:hypothetical protein
MECKSELFGVTGADDVGPCLKRDEGERGPAGQWMQNRAAVLLLEPSIGRPRKKTRGTRDVPALSIPA